MWATSFNNDLAKIDPAVPELVTYIPIPNTNRGTSHQAGIAVDATHVFVAVIGNDNIGRVYVIRKSDNSIVGLLESPYEEGHIYGIAINGDNLYVASGIPNLALSSTSDFVSQVDRFSKAEILSSYPIPSIATLATLPPSADNAYHGGFLFYAGFLYVTSAACNGWIYKLDPTSLTVVDSYSAGPGSIANNLVFVNGGIWTGYNDLSNPRIAKFNPNNLAAGPEGINIFFFPTGYGEYLSVFNDRWIIVTHGNSPFVETVDTTPDNEVAFDIDLEDGGQYGVSATDGGLIWVCNSSSLPVGVGLTLMNSNLLPNINVNSLFGGQLEITYSTVAIPPIPKETTLIYRPGLGVNIGNVYNDWSTLMNTRSTIDGPVTIIVDTSITSPAEVTPGGWDLRNNTIIKGYKGPGIQSVVPVLSIQDQAQLVNPYEFEDVEIIGNTFTPDYFPIASYSSFLDINMKSAYFTNNGTVPLISVQFGSYADVHNINMYGTSHFTGGGGPIFGTTINGVFVINLNDNVIVDADTIQITGSICSLIFQLNSLSAIYSLNQAGNTASTQSLQGQFNYATADSCVGIGNNAILRMQGQFAHSFGQVGGIATAQFSRVMVAGQSIDAGPGTLILPLGQNLSLQDGTAYTIKATCIANRRFVNQQACFVHTLFAYCSGGVATILDSTLTNSIPNGTSWTIAYTTSGPDIVATFTAVGAGAGSEVNAVVNYEWTEINAGV